MSEVRKGSMKEHYDKKAKNRSFDDYGRMHASIDDNADNGFVSSAHSPRASVPSQMRKSQIDPGGPPASPIVHNSLNSSNKSDDATKSNIALSEATHSRLALPTIRPIPHPPGAVRVRGPGWEDVDDSTDQATVQIGGPPTVPVAAVAAVSESGHAQLDGIHERKKSCGIREWRKTKILGFLLLSAAAVGLVLGIVFGVVLKDDDVPSSASSVSPSVSPTISMAPSLPLSPLSWVDAGKIEASGGATMALLPSGSRSAVVDSRFDFEVGGTLRESTVVRVYQEQGRLWSQLGNAVEVEETTSLSLSGNRLTIGSRNATTGTSVFELSDVFSWVQVGNTIEREGWTVALAQDGSAVVIESTNEVQLYLLSGNGDEWLPKGDKITTNADRVNAGSAYARMAADKNGTRVLVEQSVYQYSDSRDLFFATRLSYESASPADTPVSISGDGQVVAIAQPQSNIGGLNTGKVAIFRFDEMNGAWKQEGDDIMGDIQNGFFGWSHSLSGNGKRIVIMNNPTSGGEIKVTVFGFQGRWVPLLDDIPVASTNGTVSMSEDGERVAVGGEGLVSFYDLVLAP